MHLLSLLTWQATTQDSAVSGRLRCTCSDKLSQSTTVGPGNETQIDCNITLMQLTFSPCAEGDQGC